MKYIIGIDVGTSGTKAILFDEQGTEILSALNNYKMYQPKNGWAEQEPLDWYDASIKSIIDVLNQSKIDKIDVCGIGISGQMHGLVMLDKNDKIIDRSIIWCDCRTTTQVNYIEKIMPDYIEYTLNRPMQGFTLPKLLWVKDNLPESYKKINKILLPKDYVNFRLTGNYSTDVSDASGTGYFDVANRKWSQPVLETFAINIEWLPKVYESLEVVGTITSDISKLTGLSTNTVVIAGAGDQAAAGVGNGILTDGNTSISLGTSGVVFCATDKPLQNDGSLHVFCHAVPDTWHVMGVTQACGLSLNWFLNNFAEDYTYAQLDKMARNIQVGDNSIIYLPYLMGERTPHYDSEIRGAFVGLSAKHNIFDLYNAVLEGVAFSLKDCFNLINKSRITIKNSVVSGGGAKSEIWLQKIADILQLNLSVNKVIESGCRGVAILASVGADLYPDIITASKNFKNDCILKINYDNSNFENINIMYSKYKNLYFKLRTNK